MTTPHKYILGIFSFLCCICVLNVTAQETKPPKKEDKKQDTEKPSVAEEFDVVREYKPILADAVKIRRNPNLNDNRIFIPKVSYSLLDKRLETNSDIRQLQIQKLAPEQDASLINNYAKLGFGTLRNLLGEVYIANGKDEALQAGFYAKHLSMKGKLDKQNMSNSQFSAFGKSILEKITIDGRLGYERRGNNFYGAQLVPLQPYNLLVTPDITFQKTDFINGEAELYNRIDENSDNRLAYLIKVSAYSFKQKTDGKETNFILNGGLSKNISKFQAGFNTSIDINKITFPSQETENNLFKLNPFIKLDGDRFKLTAGINYIKTFGTNSKSYLYPAANIDYVVIDKYVTLFGELSGNVNKTSLKDLAYQNPFISDVVEIKNQIEKTKIAAGVKGTVAAGVGFKAMIVQQRIKDFQYYINDINTPQKFLVQYDDGNATITGFTGELNLSFTDNIRWDNKVEFTNYDLPVQKEAWFMPALKFNSTANIKFAQKFTFNADLYFQTETNARLRTFDSNNANTTIIESVRKIDAFADLSLGLSYQYNKQIGAFIRGNNLFNKAYERYLYYPNYGLNVLGGFTFAF